MKRYIITLVLAIAAWSTTYAMSYEKARQEALYLTDKMAYELNLNDQQYNDAYEINLDYFLSLNSESDLYEDYLSYRLSDLRHILYDWQYNLLIAADYFIRPVYWRSGGWYFSIYSHYTPGYFYYRYPSVYYHYRGGHGRINYYNGFYANRRPVWNGGMRGRQPAGGRPNVNGRGSVIHDRGGRINGNGYHYDSSRRGFGRTDRGNSFGNSSSRNPRNDYSRRGNYGTYRRDGDGMHRKDGDGMHRKDGDGTYRRDGDGMHRRDGDDMYRRDGNLGSDRGNSITNRPRNYGTENGSSRNYEGTRNPGMNREHNTSEMSKRNYGEQRSSGLNSNYSSPRSSGMGSNYSSPRSSGMGSNFGGSRSSGGGGSISRGRR